MYHKGYVSYWIMYPTELGFWGWNLLATFFFFFFNSLQSLAECLALDIFLILIKKFKLSISMRFYNGLQVFCSCRVLWWLVGSRGCEGLSRSAWHIVLFSKITFCSFCYQLSAFFNGSHSYSFCLLSLISSLGVFIHSCGWYFPFSLKAYPKKTFIIACPPPLVFWEQNLCMFMGKWFSQ